MVLTVILFKNEQTFSFELGRSGEITLHHQPGITVTRRRVIVTENPNNPIVASLLVIYIDYFEFKSVLDVTEYLGL